jgi:sugar phosphate isomerase/epimerase
MAHSGPIYGTRDRKRITVITISCSTRCFPQETLDRALMRIAWAGFNGVDVAPDPGEPLPTAALGERLEAEELRLVAVDAGSGTATTAEQALEAMAHVGRCAVMAAENDAPLVVLTAPEREQGRAEHFFFGLSRLLDALHDVPVTLALRHARGTLLETPEAFTAVRERVGSPRLAFALDPADAVLSGWDPVAAIVEPGVAHVYLTDVREGERTPFGQGEVDWNELAEALARHAYSGAVTLLLEGVDPIYAESSAQEARAVAEGVFGLGF